LCAVAGSISICIRAGYQVSTILRQPTTWIKITDAGHFVKKAFFSKRTKKLEFWTYKNKVFED